MVSSVESEQMSHVGKDVPLGAGTGGVSRVYDKGRHMMSATCEAALKSPLRMTKYFVA